MLPSIPDNFGKYKGLLGDRGGLLGATRVAPTIYVYTWLSWWFRVRVISGTFTVLKNLLRRPHLYGRRWGCLCDRALPILFHRRASLVFSLPGHHRACLFAHRGPVAAHPA